MASTIPTFIVLFSFSLIYGTYRLRLFKWHSKPLASTYESQLLRFEIVW